MAHELNQPLPPLSATPRGAPRGCGAVPSGRPRSSRFSTRSPIRRCAQARFSSDCGAFVRKGRTAAGARRCERHRTKRNPALPKWRQRTMVWRCASNRHPRVPAVRQTPSSGTGRAESRSQRVRGHAGSPRPGPRARVVRTALDQDGSVRVASGHGSGIPARSPALCSSLSPPPNPRALGMGFRSAGRSSRPRRAALGNTNPAPARRSSHPPHPQRQNAHMETEPIVFVVDDDPAMRPVNGAGSSSL